MKRLVLVILSTFLAFSLSAQKSVTTFLGIPVDGSKSAMIQKLKAKGFKYNQPNDVLTGEFNGSNVLISIATNNNVVWRVVVGYVYEVSETEVKIDFNNLCRQFERNKRYTRRPDTDYRIPEDEDISYNMIVNNKRYDAYYLQLSKDKNKIKEDIVKNILNNYPQEVLEDESKVESLMKMADEEAERSLVEYADPNRIVWFTINENYGKYGIYIFYDNRYNHSDGEDL